MHDLLDAPVPFLFGVQKIPQKRNLLGTAYDRSDWEVFIFYFLLFFSFLFLFFFFFFFSFLFFSFLFFSFLFFSFLSFFIFYFFTYIFVGCDRGY